MNKNLEELKRRIEIRDKVGYINEESIIEMLYNFVPILENLEKRLGKLEKKEEEFRPRIRLIKELPMKKGGLNEMPTTPRPWRKPRGQRVVESGKMNHLEIGAKIGKSKEGPEATKRGYTIKAKTKNSKIKLFKCPECGAIYEGRKNYTGGRCTNIDCLKLMEEFGPSRGILVEIPYKSGYGMKPKTRRPKPKPRPKKKIKIGLTDPD